MKNVVKVGGEILLPENAGELREVARGVKGLLARGERVVVIHGGGPQTTALQRSLGTEAKIVGGRRVTDQPALDAIKMVVGGRLNIDLVGAFLREGVSAVGLSGPSGRAIRCVKRPPRVVKGSGDDPIDLGFVGDVVGVNEALLELLAGAGYLPVVACIGADDEGSVYNINADTVASAIAAELCADRLLFLTGAAGVLRVVSDPASRIPRLDLEEARRAIDSGAVQGGMIPKLEEAFAALEKGVREVHVLGRLAEGDLLRALDTPGSVGTVLLARARVT